jgi:hypothetical protein
LPPLHGPKPVARRLWVKIGEPDLRDHRCVLDEVREWQARPLEPVWPAIFLDAIMCKVRDQGTVRNKAAHLAVAIALVAAPRGLLHG